MSEFYLPWIPEISYFENKIKHPFNLDKALEYIQLRIKEKEIFQSIEIVFWTLAFLFQIGKIEIVDKKLIEKYISTLKHKDGGYKLSENFNNPDIWSTFYCIASLKLLDLDDNIREKDKEFVLKSQNRNSASDGGFIHCRQKVCHFNCNGKTSVKSSFFALSTLKLLYQLDEIEKEPLLKFLKKNISGEKSQIYQLFCLDILNQLENAEKNKFEKTISSWQIPKSGFGSSGKFPSIDSTFWAIISLGLLGGLKQVDFGGILEFFQTMQKDNGGFADQYTSISSQEPSLFSTIQGLICIYYIWDVLIDEIEREILFKARNSTDVYFNPISKKFAVPTELVEVIVKWLIANKWIEAKILDNSATFQAYFDQQNAIQKEIIRKIRENVNTNPKQKILDLNEFSKHFEFSNALERVKIVINDLIINNLFIGNITQLKKRFIFEDYSILDNHVQFVKSIPYSEIMNEKKQVIEAKYELLTLQCNMTEFLLNASKLIQKMVVQEEIFEAKKKLNEVLEFSAIKVRKFEDLMVKIRSSHEFVNSEKLLAKFEEKWPQIKVYIDESFTGFRAKFIERIQKKEKFISDREEIAKENKDLSFLEDLLSKNLEKLTRYQGEIQNFFLKNYKNHKSTLKLIETLSGDIKKSDSIMDSKIKEVDPTLVFDKYEKELEEIKTTWTRKREEAIQYIGFYKKKVEKREELHKIIADKASEIQKFIEQNNDQITQLIEQNKFQKSTNSLNDATNKFDSIISTQDRMFNEQLDKINSKIMEFPKFSSDITVDWNTMLKDKESKWNTVIVELKKKLHSDKEVATKDELDINLKDKVEDIEWFMDNMKKTVFKLIDSKNFSDAGDKTNDMYAEIRQKIQDCDEDFKEYIKNQKQEFKTIRDTAKDLIEFWDKEKKKLNEILIDIKKELESKLDITGSIDKKAELHDLINTQVAELEERLSKLEPKYSQILYSGKNIDEIESQFEEDFSKLRLSLKSLDNQVKSSIKTVSRIYEEFSKIIVEEVDFWNILKLATRKKIDKVYNQIGEEVFIKRVQFIVGAFSGKKIDLSYLAKVMNMKIKPLKLKLINLISNSKIVGELDSSTDTLTLKGTTTKGKYPAKKKGPITAEPSDIGEETDPIKQDILSLRYLMVIHNDVGATVYSRKLGTWQMDSDLIGGFLTAMQDFSLEIKKKQIPIKRMEYKEFEIILEQGKYILVALFIDGKGSDWLLKKQQLYVKKFEKYFSSNLQHWKGELTFFNNSGFLVDEVFELYRV